MFLDAYEVKFAPTGPGVSAMPTNGHLKGGARFGAFELDTLVGLRKGGKRLHLPPQPFRVLSLLVSRAGELVTREELQQQLWNGDTFVDFEQGLNVCIRQIRAVLNDSADDPRFVQTVPRRGYRFIAPVNGKDVSGRAEAAESAVVSTSLSPQGKRVALRLPARKKKLFMLILLLAALLIVVGRERVLLSRLGRGKPIASQLQLQSMQFAQLTTTGTSPMAAISPDGKYVAYVVEESGKQKLVLEHLATRSVAVVFPPAASICCGITFSRDGNYIYYVTSSDPARPEISDAYQVPLLGGNARKVALDVNSGLAPSLDGRKWAFIRLDRTSGHSLLVVANAETLKERVLGTHSLPQLYWGTPAWSPDGTQIAVGLTTVAGGQGTVVTIPASGGSEKKILAGDRLQVDSLGWLADRSGLVLVGREREMPSQLWLLSYPDGGLRRISNDLNSYSGLSLTADSTRLLCVEKQTVSAIWVLAGKNLENLRQIRNGTDLETDSGGIAWTPEGKLIFPSRVGDAVDLWMIGPDGSNARQLTEQGDNNDQPAVSSDGHTIIFVAHKNGVFNLWRMTVDGSSLQQLTSGNSDDHPQISPDGDWVVFVSRRTGKPTLWKIRADGKNEVQLTTDYGHTPVISPDGKFIAFNHLDAAQHFQAAIMSFAGGRPLKTLGVAAPWTVRWTPDGRGLTFRQSGDNFSNVWRQPLNGGKPTRLTHFTDQEISDYAWSKNGDLALMRKKSLNDVVLLKLR